MAKSFKTGISVDGSVGIGTTSPDDELHVVGDVKFEVSDDGSSAQPEVTLHRESSSPADGDYLGQFKFSGKNDAGQTVNYAKVTGKISDATDTTEDGLIEIATVKAGSQNIGYRLTSTDLKLINGTGLEVDGNVGIGNTSPTQKLDVTGTVTATALAVTGEFTLPTADGSADQVLVTNGSGTVSWADQSGGGASVTVSDTAPGSPSEGDLWFESDTGKTFVYYNDGSSSQWVEVGAASAAASGNDGAVQFSSGGALSSDTTNFYWDDANNRLGIGTNSPSYTLDVNGTGRFTGTLNVEGIVTLSDEIKGGSGSAADPVFTFASDGDTGMYSAGTNALGFTTGGTSRLVIQSDGDLEATGNITLDGDLTGTSNTNFFVKNDSGEEILFQESSNQLFFKTNGTYRAYFNSSGHFLPYADNTYDIGNSGYRFDDIFATNGTIQTSDQRDKTSITDLDLGLNFINDLRPVSFIWNDRGGYTGTREHMGFIAQEVASTLGDQASDRAVWINSPAGSVSTVDGTEDFPDRQGIRYEELIAPLVKAIQELSALNTSQQTTIAALEGRIAALEAE